jgi:hypothetical protein
MHRGIRRNVWMTDVREGVTTAANTTGDGPTSGPNGQIVVFLVGAWVNHPVSYA